MGSVKEEEEQIEQISMRVGARERETERDRDIVNIQAQYVILYSSILYIFDAKTAQKN